MRSGRKTIIPIMVAVFCIVAGSYLIVRSDLAAGSLVKAREAIGDRDYGLASRQALWALVFDPMNREARVMVAYLKYGDNMLVAAFWEKDSEALRYLAGIVHDINTRDPRFEAPVLVLAAAWGHTGMVEILLEAGADPNYGTGSRGLTALMWACKNFDEQLEMVRALLEAGADVNATSNIGETPLSIAKVYLNDNIVILLKEYGAVE